MVSTLYEVRRALLMGADEALSRMRRCQDIAQRHYLTLGRELDTLFDELAVYFR